MDAPMDMTEFDSALIREAFAQAAARGWRSVSVAAAARAAGLPLTQARARFPSRSAILLRFGVLADKMALADVTPEAPARETLFDLLMRRFDALQAHRPGIVALLHALPADPPAALLLTLATLRSMRWMLDAAGVPTGGPLGALRVQALLGVWLYALRAWEKDESADLSATMAALDRALDRAERLADWVERGPGHDRRPLTPSPVHPTSPASVPSASGSFEAGEFDGPEVPTAPE
jgi:ubiquinone biosynthesis protein COQ9